MHKKFHLLGYAYGDAAGDSGCQDGPLAFKASTYWQILQKNPAQISWDDTFYPLVKSNIPVGLQDARLGAEVTRDLDFFDPKNPKEYLGKNFAGAKFCRASDPQGDLQDVNHHFEGFSGQKNSKVDVRSDAQSRILKSDGYKYETTAAICQRLAITTQTLIQKGHHVITLGGDHSSAIGTWHGVKQAVAAQGDIGLIWVDAHMDSHTPQTSLSGNIHGMPLAVLLGYGDDRLTQLTHLGPTLLPQNVCLIGVRSFESGEAQLLNHLGVRVFYREEVKQRGVTAVFQEALSIVSQNTVGFGVSIDLDAIDPTEAPGVGSPAPDGLPLEPLCQALWELASQPHFLAAEIAEFNPHYDQQQKTAHVIYQLITHLIEGIYHEPTH